MLLYVVLAFLACYSKFVTIATTELTGRILTFRFNPVTAVIFGFTRILLRLVRLISWFVPYCCL